MEPYLGEIRLFAFPWAPQDWSTCEGQVLPIQQNVALFSLIGTTYGGNGQTTFALPTVPGPGDGAIYCIALQGVFPNRP